MEILNTYNGSMDGDALWLMFIFAIVCVVFLLFFAKSVNDKKFGKSMCFLVLIIFSGWLSYGFFIIGSLPTEVIKHEVIITDMNKFDYDKYKIIDQRGKIFTIEKIKR